MGIVAYKGVYQIDYVGLVMVDTVSILWSIGTFVPILRYFVSILSYPIFVGIDTVSLYR